MQQLWVREGHLGGSCGSQDRRGVSWGAVVGLGGYLSVSWGQLWVWEGHCRVTWGAVVGLEGDFGVTWGAVVHLGCHLEVPLGIIVVLGCYLWVTRWAVVSLGGALGGHWGGSCGSGGVTWVSLGGAVVARFCPRQRDNSLCRGLVLNSVQRGSCSATYETVTQSQGVYE